MGWLGFPSLEGARAEECDRSKSGKQDCNQYEAADELLVDLTGEGFVHQFIVLDGFGDRAVGLQRTAFGLSSEFGFKLEEVAMRK